MDSYRLAARVGEILSEHLVVDGKRPVVKTLGNRLHVEIDSVEYVLVTHTTLPERRWVEPEE